MTEDVLKLEADAEGIWISALTDELTLAAVTAFLRANGVRKYEQKAVAEFVEQKSRTPKKIAKRNDVEEKNALVVVQLSKDQMSASVVVEPPFFTKPWPSEQEIEESLSRKNVVFGIDKEAIEQLIKLKLAYEPIIVAHGQVPKNGKNARIEMLIDPDQAPVVDQEAQKIDHRTRSAVVSVRRGDRVAVKHPLTTGENGMSVVGTVLKAVSGKDVMFSVDSGFEISEDGTILTAAIDGHLLRRDRKLSIRPELEVKGDVDFSAGNIHFMGSVKILGAVRDGFEVIASGNIDIKDMVEGAHVESSGDVIIHGGVRGMGKGRIIAAGKIVAGFVDQAYMRSADIEVKKSIFHSDVAAQRSVTVLGGQKSQIAGGKIQAGLEVKCQTLGSEMETKTEVVVGIPPEQSERRKELQTLIAQYKENIEKLDTRLEYLRKQELTSTLDTGKRAMMLGAIKSQFQIQAALNSMIAELKEIEERLERTKSQGVVRVKGTCYPGVVITIRGFSYVVKKPFQYSSFVFDEGEIRFRSFE
ncbi:MAG: FapA family protein [Synergistaceae bacterium]|jgi:uncharacterized protein (DUF342 family)|nr:FapA family protein [Synergistaceae bacterium]